MRSKLVPILFLQIIFIATFLFSCKSAHQKVGILLPTNSFQPDCDVISAILKANNIEVVSANAQLDAGLQIKQANELIEKGIDLMIIIPVNTNTAAEIVRNCKTNDIKTIAYERLISNSEVDYFISFDNIRVGEMMAQAAVDLKPTGKYVILNGDRFDRNAKWVNEGFMKVIGDKIKSGEIEVVYNTNIEGWTREGAYFEFEQYMQSTMPMPDVVLAAHSRMSTAVVNVLEKMGTENYPVITGQNVDTPENREIWHPNQKISLFKSYKVEGKAAGELVLKVLNGQQVKVDKTFFNGMVDVPSIVLKDMSLETH